MVWQIQIQIDDLLEGVQHINEFTYWNRGKCQLIKRVESSEAKTTTKFTLQVVVDASQTTATVHFAPTADGHLLRAYTVNVESELAEVLPEHELAVRHGISS